MLMCRINCCWEHLQCVRIQLQNLSKPSRLRARYRSLLLQGFRRHKRLRPSMVRKPGSGQICWRQCPPQSLKLPVCIEHSSRTG